MAWLNILVCDTAKEKDYDIEKIIGGSNFSECTVFITSDRKKAAEIIESDQLLSLMIIGYDPDKIEDGNEALDFIKKFYYSERYSNIPSIFLYFRNHEEISKDAENYATITINKNNIDHELNKAIAMIISK